MPKKLTISIASWNIRSLRNHSKMVSVLNSFKDSKEHILCLQETWHDKHTLIEIKDICEEWAYITASPAKPSGAKGEGVITLTKKNGGTNAQPILAAIHSQTAIATLNHFKYNDSKLQKCIVINFYDQPLNKSKSEKELIFLTNSLRQMHP